MRYEVSFTHPVELNDARFLSALQSRGWDIAYEAVYRGKGYFWETRAAQYFASASDAREEEKEARAEVSSKDISAARAEQRARRREMFFGCP